MASLENPRGQRSLAGRSPWGHKELDTTEVSEQTRMQPWQKKESNILYFLFLLLTLTIMAENCL